MKYLICSDNHFTRTSSVITGHDGEFSDRLENQRESIKWAASFGLKVLHLGDFFDKDVLTAEEISCLAELKKEVDFSDWTFLQGNHGYSGGFDVMGVFENQLITEPTDFPLGKYDGLLLPFRAKLEDVERKYDVIFAHAGVEGIPFGAKGFKPEDIREKCRIFLNGHLHNRESFGEGMMNIGSLTAQNFSDNAMGNRPKGAWIFDTSDLSLEFVENPYAFNFYKTDFQGASQLSFSSEKLKRSCLSISCEEGQEDELREKFKGAYYLRLNVHRKKDKSESEVVEIKAVDYLNRFRESFIEKQGDSTLILEELAEVCK